MKKTNRFNIPEIGEVKFVHPLRLNGDEAVDAYWKAVPAKDKRDALAIEKLAQLNELTNRHLPNYPDFSDPKCAFLREHLGNDFAKLEKIKWRFMQNSTHCLHVFATIPFNNSQEMSLTLTESFSQYFTEALSHFGARYGRSPQCWVLYLPNFDLIAFSDIQAEFIRQVQSSWTRLSNIFQKYTLQTIITPELILRPKNPDQTPINSNFQPTFFFHKKQPISLLDVYNSINTITDPAQKSQAILVSKLCSKEGIKVENRSARQSLLKSLILLEYICREKIPHTFYSEIFNDTLTHLALKSHANELLAKKELLFAKNPTAQTSEDGTTVNDLIDDLNAIARNPSFILIINMDINTEYPLLNMKLDEAVHSSNEEEHVFFRVKGPLNNLTLEQVDDIKFHGVDSTETEYHFQKSNQ